MFELHFCVGNKTNAVIEIKKALRIEHDLLLIMTFSIAIKTLRGNSYLFCVRR